MPGQVATTWYFFKAQFQQWLIAMKCTVFRSIKKEYTYIYLKDGFAFDELPPTLKTVFGEYETVMTLELTPERKLAYENVKTVLQNLTEQGFHLQMPPTQDATGLLDLPKTKELLL